MRKLKQCERKSMGIGNRILGLLLGCIASSQAGALERLDLAKLAATHAAVQELKAQREPVTLESGYRDFRAILHAHSHLSHDSRAPIEEILAGAKAAAVDVILFSEHPSQEVDYIRDGHQGMRDGVLLIPGAETEGFLAYPKRTTQGLTTKGPQEFADLVLRFDGLIFLCHVEERMDWTITGITGTEIYNTHWDAKSEKGLFAALASPLWWFRLLPVLRDYPMEVYASFQDYPADYLARYDELCQIAKHTGVAGNDSHHNIGVVITWESEKKLLVTDLLGKKILELDPSRARPLQSLIEGKQVGDEVFKLDLDPYDRSFGYVSTHLLMRELTVESVWETLRHGRAYVAFDWLADPTGFAFLARRSANSSEDSTIILAGMGDEINFEPGMELVAEAPLAGHYRLVRDGTILAESTTRRFHHPIDAPGVYRIEVFLSIAGEDRPWILSNPIYIRPAKPDRPIPVEGD